MGVLLGIVFRCLFSLVVGGGGLAWLCFSGEGCLARLRCGVDFFVGVLVYWRWHLPSVRRALVPYVQCVDRFNSGLIYIRLTVVGVCMFRCWCSCSCSSSSSRGADGSSRAFFAHPCPGLGRGKPLPGGGSSARSPDRD